ncbi:MAG: metallophosphoesterase, partial [Candidatus Latescibacter sp.]|nr:metallophosphoesterase [Candidatus Latescibacter sp.]
MNKHIKKSLQWLLGHALTVFSCVAIIVLGMSAIAYSSTVPTIIGENISTNNLTASGNLEVGGNATTIGNIVVSGDLSVTGTSSIRNAALGGVTTGSRSIEPDFTIVLFPDTQLMVKNNPAVWRAMPQWVLDNKTSQNIQAVIGLGDVTEDHTIGQFTEAKNGWNVVDATGLPYMPIIGNHDYNSLPDNLSSRDTTNWNSYFGISTFSGKSWYGGAYNNSTDNYWIKFDVGSHKYLVLALEVFPRSEVLTWAQGIIDANTDREVIIATHAYLNTDGTRILHGDSYGPDGLNVASDNDAQQMWDSLIKLNSNIILVVS